ncbi:hypothetical protein DFH28DRAFT_1080040 [Melampsora americana]|nr:hypothetical protein DFH28DRAFT_1080040 [Melampsora americana]
MSPREALAATCPLCLGPKVPVKQADEPDHIFCLDANFQQRRHLAASAAWRGDTGVLPSLFMSPERVMTWKRKLEPTTQTGPPAGNVVDPCRRQTWRGCDETGSMGMTCQHDILLKFINIVQSGERSAVLFCFFPKFGVLYDIGCNMEKSIIKGREQGARRLKFGTSVFHSYVHQWVCQLKIWASLASLVGALRYSTKAHRLCALALRTRHTNEAKRRQSSWVFLHYGHQMLHAESMQKLNALQRTNNIYSLEYFQRQWTRQRDSQLRALLIEDSKLDKMKRLQAKPRHCQKASENRKPAHLPVILVILDEEIQGVVHDLGSNHYRDMADASMSKGKNLIRIRVAKSKLYGAKVDVFESQRKNNEREGTRMQQQSKKHPREKQSPLKTKYNTFHHNIDKFNTEFPSQTPIEFPSFKDILGMTLENQFWDIGQLTYPGKAWAMDPGTKDGIRAYLDMTHSRDEMTTWALNTQEKLSVLSPALQLEGLYVFIETVFAITIY